MWIDRVDLLLLDGGVYGVPLLVLKKPACWHGKELAIFQHAIWDGDLAIEEVFKRITAKKPAEKQEKGTSKEVRDLF